MPNQPPDVSVNKKIIRTTPFGPVGVIWTGVTGNPRIVRVLISKPGWAAGEQAWRLYPDARTSSCAGVDAVSAAIAGILEGDAVEIALEVVELDRCPAFQQSVLRAAHRIPRGSVSTYRLIAGSVGNSNGARAAGNALASNPFPLIVPCHRVIRSDRHPGGYQGGRAMKRALLEKEGIPFDDAGRVACPRFHYEGGLADMETPLNPIYS
ncbi:MAG: MGMT family protein [PVC group bacterium]